MHIGLYLSRAQGRVAAVVDLDALASRFSAEADIVRIVDDVFDPAVRSELVREIAERPLDAVVIAGRSPDQYRHRLSSPQLKQELVDAGLNPNRVVFANLLEQVAYPHAKDPKGAAVKAEAVVSVALLQARMSQPAVPLQTQPRRAALVLGASVPGMVAVQRLLRLGFEVVLADRGRWLSQKAPHGMGATAAFIVSHPAAIVLEQARITDGLGWAGDYEIVLDTPEGSRTVHVGGILLAEPQEPAWVTELREHFRVDVDDRGAARSLDPRSHPAETVDPGIAVVPPSEADGGLRAEVGAADSASLTIALLLSSEEHIHYAEISQVDEKLCGGCASCVKTCAFGACSIDPEAGLSRVDVRRCQGCGKCLVSCPVGARDLVSSPHGYLVESIRTLAKAKADGKRVLGFLCRGCGYPAADRAGEAAVTGGETYPASFMPLQIPCGGRLDALYVLEAFKEGFDGVSVFRCSEGHCHNLIGNLDMDRRMNLLRTVLRSRDIDGDRLRIVDVIPQHGGAFSAALNSFYSDLGRMRNVRGGRNDEA